jgi:hypothetical protein
MRSEMRLIENVTGTDRPVRIDAHADVPGRERAEENHSSSAAARQRASADPRAFDLQPELFLYLPGACHRAGDARIDFEVVEYVLVDTIELPSRQADQPITTQTFPRLENVQRREDADRMKLERSCSASGSI